MTNPRLSVKLLTRISIRHSERHFPLFESLPAQDFATPCLVIDSHIVDANIQRMQGYATQHSLRLRPHTKTHKSLVMAHKQISAGASGLTVAKVGEAEVMSRECDSLLIAYPAIGKERLRRTTDLAKRINVLMAIDSPEAAQLIGDAAQAAGVKINILVDIDVGFHRTGLSDLEAIIQLAQCVDRNPALQVQGIMCFPGHLLPSDGDQAWTTYADSVGEVIQTLQRSGICTDIISGGSTPTAMLSHRNRWLNEIRPGTYIYNDMNEVRLGVATLDDCAARVLATVVSTSKNKFVLDSGSKTLSSDRCGPAPDSGFGYVVEYPNGKIVRLSEEHGEVQLPDGEKIPCVGDRVTIIPNHICVCVNLQNQFWLYENEQFTSHPVDARGMIV